MSTGRDYRTRSLHTRGAAGERHQRDVARALDSHAKPALVPRANASHTARKNLAALLHELRQNVRALIVDKVHLLDAKLADFFLAEILALAAARPARPSARSAFAARTSVAAAWAAMTAGTPFTTRTSARGRARCLRLFLFLCHTCLPFQIVQISNLS